MPLNVYGIPTITSGRKVVTTAARLVAVNTPCKLPIITAETDNTGIIAVGGSTVVAAEGTQQGNLLLAGESITLPIDDVYDVYIAASVSGDGVSFNYFV